MRVLGRIRKKFGLKVFAGYLVVVLALSIAFSVIFIRHQSRSLSDNLMEKGNALAELASYDSRLGVFSENLESLDSVAEGLMRQEGVLSFDVYSLDGKPFYRKGRIRSLESGRVREIMDKLRKRGDPYFVIDSDLFEFWATVSASRAVASDEYLFFGVQAPPAGQRAIGFVRIDIDSKSIGDSRRALIARAIAITLAFIIVGAVVSLVITRGITRPLKLLHRGVREFAKGGTPARIPVNTADEVGSLASAFNDMTELLRRREGEMKKLIEQLGHSQKLEAIGTLAGGVSHDFNNILSIIQSNAELAEMKAPEYVREYVARIMTATGRGKNLVDRLLNLSHDGLAVNMPVNLELLARETIKLFEKNTDRRISAKLDIPENLWKARGDAGQIQQVIMNLYSNAHDAILDIIDDMKRPPEIRIALENVVVDERGLRNKPQARTGEYVKLSVIDNGPGMAPHVKGRVFEPFFTTRDMKGKGLGLSTVYGIVKHHGGWIEVESEMGKGAAFDVYLPKGPEITDGAQNGKAVARGEYPGGFETILIVDDEAHIVEALGEKLQDVGYKVLTANTGNMAVEILEKHKREIDLVILDYVLPDVSGIEIYQYLKTADTGAKVLMHTGKDVSPYADFLKGVEVVKKPCSLDDLCIKIREMLGFEFEHPLKSNISRVKYYYKDEKTAPYDDELDDMETVYRLFRHIAHKPQEKFIVIYLDARKIIAYEEMSIGTVNKTLVYPREVVKGAIFANASSVVLVHNHPSDNLAPSANDFILTASISQACKVLDINVLDHLIIGKSSYYSFSLHGDL